MTATGTVQVPSGAVGRPLAVAARAANLKLRKDTADIGPGETETLKLRIPRKTKRAIANALDAGATPKAKIQLKAVDAAGNSSRKRLRIKLK